MATVATSSFTDATWWAYALPALLGSDTLCAHPALFAGALLLAFVSAAVLAWAASSGGPAWAHGRGRRGKTPINGPRGLPVFGSIFALSRGLPHRALAAMARAAAPGARELMAFSVGETPAVVSSCPATAREVLAHPAFADRPLKRSARELLFARVIGFAPSGEYWRLLRRIASTHLFSPRRVATHEPDRQADAAAMLRAIAVEQSPPGAVVLRTHLQAAALNNIMGSVFGRRYDVSFGAVVEDLKSMVRKGFDLLSWASLATADVRLSNGMVVPMGTTAMVNTWAITRDAAVWADPEAFAPERFLPSEGGADADVRSVDLRLAPFGAGRRVCPSKNLGLATVSLWVARLVHAFDWALPEGAPPVCLDEVPEVSLEMKTLLAAAAVPRSL